MKIISLRKNKTKKDIYNRELISGDNKTCESRISNSSSQNKDYFKKLRIQKRNSKKKHSGEFKAKETQKLRFIDKIVFNFHAKVISKHIDSKELSFDSKYKTLRSQKVQKYILEKNKVKDEGFSSIKKTNNIYKKSRKNKTVNLKQKSIQKEKIAIIKAEAAKKINFTKEKRAEKKISRNAYKQEKSAIRIIRKGDIGLIKLEKDVTKNRDDFMYSFFQHRKRLKRLKKIHNSEQQFLAATVPNDVRNGWRKITAPILELIFPGIGSIINKEYFKGIILLICSAMLYGLTLMLSTGIINIKINGTYHGDGILGLITLGSHSTGFQPDSRFFLIFGILSLLFIMITMTYSILFSRIAYKKAVAINLGFRGAGRIGLKKYLDTAGFPYLVITPIYVIIVFTSIFPLLTSMLIVFTNYGERGHTAPVHLITWVGFDNLKNIFNFSGREGGFFLQTLSWSFIWGIGATLTSMTAGIGLALLVNHPRFKGKKFVRVLFMLPTAVPFFIMVLYFRTFFGPQGTMNHDIVRIFMPWTNTANLEISPGVRQEFADVSWFSEVNKIKGLLFVINIWFGFAGMFLFITGLLQGISKELYEAVDVAGGGAFTKFSKVTAPTLLFQISPLLIGAFIGGFNNFGLIYLFTEGGPRAIIGGPGETDILASYVFKLVRDEAKPALAAAYMFAISIIFGAVGLAGFSRTKTFRKGKF